jgi:hypothetical protein
MSLIAQAFREFAQGVPLAGWLLSAFCVALVLESVVIVLALRRGAAESSGEVDAQVARRRKALVYVVVSGFVAVGFPLLVHASFVRIWARTRGALTLATGAERAAEYSSAMGALLNASPSLPILVMAIELLACIAIGLSLADLWSLRQTVPAGARHAPTRVDGGEIVALFAIFLLLSIGPVVLGGLWHTFALSDGFKAVGQSPISGKLQAMSSMLGRAQGQLDAAARWALPGTLMAAGIAVTLLLSRTRRWVAVSADRELQAWQRTLIFQLVCVLAGMGLLAWSAPLKAEAEKPFPLPTVIPVVRFPAGLPPTVEFVGPDEVDTGPLVVIERLGTTLDGRSFVGEEMVRQLRASTAWQLRDGQPPIQVQADKLSVVMAPDTPMRRLASVSEAARGAGYVKLIFVSTRVERIVRPMLGTIDHHCPTAAVAWLTEAPERDQAAEAIQSHMNLGDYADYGAFIRELVARRRSHQPVVLGPPRQDGSHRQRSDEMGHTGG